MSKKKSTDAAAPIADDEVTPPLGTQTPEGLNTPALGAIAPDAKEPAFCAATKGDKQCSLLDGHAGHHHHVPAPSTIDAIVTWA